jgi:hypothetical protein
MVATVEADDGFRVTGVEELFPVGPYVTNQNTRRWVIPPDGGQFLMIRGNPPAPELQIILNAAKGISESW